MAEQAPRVARIDQQDLADVPAPWTHQERGQYLRLLLCGRGIDPNRLFQTEYFPNRRCWVLTQRTAEPAEPPPSPGHGLADRSDETFYLQTLSEFRRAARFACRTLAAQSTYFACYG